jgi:hypothetical protein
MVIVDNSNSSFNQVARLQKKFIIDASIKERGRPSIRGYGVELVGAGIEAIDNVRSLMKAVKKSAEVPLFPKDNRLVQFLKLNPIAAKFFLFTQFLTFVDLVTYLHKLPKRFKVIVKGEGLQRCDAIVAVTSISGKILGCLTSAIACLQLFRFAKKWKWLSCIPLDQIALLGSFLASASILHKSYKAFAIHRTQKAMERQAWYRSDGCYTSKEYQLFKKYINDLSDTEATALGKACKVKGSKLKKALSAKLLTDDPSQADLQQMAQLVETVARRVITRKRFFLFTAAIGTLDLTATLCMLSPPLYPAASLLIVAISCGKLFSKLIIENTRRYQFEAELGLIDRPAPAPTWKARAIDFAKWQIGWYENRDILLRIANASNCIGTGTTQTAAVISNSIRAVAVAAALTQSLFQLLKS